MSDLLNIGASGLRAYSRALSTIGDNIANAQTPGYARRTLELVENQAASNMPLYRSSIKPGGVAIQGVTRSVDQWLIQDSRISSGDAERSATKLDWMNKVEAAMSDDSNGIATGLGKLFNTADLLTADPSNPTLRAQFLQSVDDVASGFRTAAGQLSSMADGISSAAAGEVDSFNTNLNALEQINIGLRKARPGSTNEASLLDERDRLLDELSTQAGVPASFDSHGAVTLTATATGDTLVGGGVVTPISVSAAADGRLSYSIGADATSSNGNMLAIGGMRGSNDPESAWSAHMATQAQATASARAQDAAATTRRDAASAARSAVSEIDLDREAADLLRFQQAYSAAARTIQVARDTMQALLNAV